MRLALCAATSLLLLSMVGVSAQAQNETGDGLGMSPTPQSPARNAGPSSWTRFVSLRPAPGMMISLGSKARLAAAFDVTAGARLFAPMGPPRLAVSPELGYSYAATSPASQHRLTLGMGMGLGGLNDSALGFSLVPRLVMTVGEPVRSVGVRTGIQVGLAGLATMELSHQYVDVLGQDDHSLRLLFGVDFGMAVQVLATGHRRERN